MKAIKKYFIRLWYTLINKTPKPLTKKEEFYNFLEENKERIQFLMTSGPNTHYSYEPKDLKKIIEGKYYDYTESKKKFRDINQKLDKLNIKLDAYLTFLKNSEKKLVSNEKK